MWDLLEPNENNKGVVKNKIKVQINDKNDWNNTMDFMGFVYTGYHNHFYDSSVKG